MKKRCIVCGKEFDTVLKRGVKKVCYFDHKNKITCGSFMCKKELSVLPRLKELFRLTPEQMAARKRILDYKESKKNE